MVGAEWQELVTLGQRAQHSSGRKGPVQDVTPKNAPPLCIVSLFPSNLFKMEGIISEWLRLMIGGNALTGTLYMPCKPGPFSPG